MGIDHALSFPESYFKRYKLNSWPEFLEDYCHYWPTDRPDIRIDQIRERNPKRKGQSNEFRLTENRTSSAKSVFLFDVTGQVAKSTHAGIPWIKKIRDEAGKKIHFYPFDGWKIPSGKSVITEVYPSIFRNRYPAQKRTTDEQDAYAVSRWLREADENNFLSHYMNPPLTNKERQTANLEGWILGIC